MCKAKYPEKMEGLGRAIDGNEEEDYYLIVYSCCGSD